VEVRAGQTGVDSTALCEEALAVARRVNDPEALATALTASYLAMRDPGRARVTLTAMADLADAIGDRELACRSHLWLCWDHLERAGDIDDADAELATAAGLAEELRLPFFLWWTRVIRAMRAILAGRFAEGERIAEEARRIGERMDSEPVRFGYLWQMFALRREQGRLTELEEELIIAAQHSQRPTRMLRVMVLWCESGRTTEARRAFEELAADGFGAVPSEASRIAVLCLLAEICAVLGDAAHAAPLYARLLPYEAYTPVLTPMTCAFQGSIARYLGLLAGTMSRWEEAARHFEHAIGVHERMGARPLLAHTRREYAAMLLARRGRGDATRARSLLDQALALYDELGMEHYAAQSRTLLADPRLTVASSPAPTYPNGLSEREVEVLRLVAAGRSNPEIAEALVISRNTVERHVNHILTKIGAANRVEAATYAHRRGLMSDERGKSAEC
jgi:DNA-binding CsgD family transcriptional regulator